jgi:general secretion pathway protein G
MLINKGLLFMPAQDALHIQKLIVGKLTSRCRPRKQPFRPHSLSDTISSMNSRKKTRRRSERGMTLLELIIASSILVILASAALPTVRFMIVRPKEAELRRDLREMRNAIDRYKDYSDLNFIRAKFGSEGYPPDLDTLVKGVQVGAGDNKVRFLRRVPVDPMTGQADWNLQAVQDDPDSTSWGGNDVFDVHSKSQATALDGTRYSDW